MMTPLEIKGVIAAVIISVLILAATFTAGGIYRNRYATERQPGTKALSAETLAVKGRSYFLQSCAH